MRKKIVKILIRILLILLLFQMANYSTVKAGFVDNVINDANKFVEDGKEGKKEDSTGVMKDVSVTNDEKLKETSTNIYNTLLVLGIVFSVIIGGALGIQIMWGSIEQQVKAKEMLMPYAAGCVVTFGAFGIWKLCVTIFSQL